MNTKAIFFDIKNVLLYFDPDKMLSQIADYCGQAASAIQETITKENWQEKYERGEIDTRTLYHCLPEHIRQTHGFSQWSKACADVFAPNSALFPLLKRLKQSKVRLFILSNICEIQFSYAYTHFSAFHFFEKYFLSYEMGAKKPEQKLFEQALEKTSTSPCEAFFIEGYEEYAMQARSYGLDSKLYRSPDLLEKELMTRGCLL